MKREVSHNSLESSLEGARNIMLLSGLVLLWQLVQSFGQNATSRYNVSEPLLLTPFLEGGKIKEAQNVSRVYIEDYPDIVSYSGFFTVDKDFNSNLFFWFFPAANGNKSAPVLLWLNGGPGATSFYGLLLENGPFSVSQDLRLERRNVTWASFYSVVYIDNPAGTGYSFTDPGGYVTNETQVGNQLYNALMQFFTLFPDLQANEFFVTGESYAGKYIPAVCYFIHNQNPNATLKINLQGFAIGNGLIDPVHMVNYGDFLYQIGLVDKLERDFFKLKEQEIVQYIRQKEWRAAFNLFALTIEGYGVDTTTFNNFTGYTFYYNFLYENSYFSQQVDDIQAYLSTAAARKMLHIGNSNSTFSMSNDNVTDNLLDDVMQSVKPWFEVLVEHYRVLIYNGQLDIIVAVPLTEAFIDKLCWSGADAYRAASRKLWYIEDVLAGYSKTAKNFTFLEIRNVGHLVPTDQPEWALDMISKFVENQFR